MSAANGFGLNQNNSSDETAHDEIKDNSAEDEHFDKIFSGEGDCIFEGSIKICSNNETFQELVDFEDLIDRTRNCNEDKSLEDINEFEKVLSTLESAKPHKDDEEVLNIEEISNIFDNLATEIISISSQDDLISNDNDVGVDENFNDYSNNEFENNIAPTDHTSIISTVKNERKCETQLDTISISSEENRNSDDDGYNSSDFEFITESEAKMDGFIINFRRNDSTNSKLDTSDCSLNNLDIKHSKEENYYLTSNSSQTIDETGSNEFDPGEGPSGFHRQVDKHSNEDYRQHHVVPEEENYIELFRGQYGPLSMCDVIMLENKSIRPSPMNAQYAGLGFDMLLIARRHQLDSSEEEYEDEAKESFKEILSMYPDENKPKRRRRF